MPPAKQTLIVYNFDDEYADDRTLAELPYIHLHGCVTWPTIGFVFSREEYIRQITAINPWMTVLSQFIRSEPFIVAGSSLDEVDLDFYLAHRSTVSARDDRGPSIRVEPYPDNVTRNDCANHGMLLFVGTFLDFLNYCEGALPHRPTPHELIPAETVKIVPEGVSKTAALAFLSDFELVPGTELVNVGASRFLYGHAPSWSDLESGIDISRLPSQKIINDIEKRLDPSSNEPKLLIIREATGTGKTTVLRRCAYELAKRGHRVLNCSALSRVEVAPTASIIDLMDEPLVLIVDNFADQVSVFAELVDTLEKKDVVVLAADRTYRFRYIQQALSGVSYTEYNDLALRPLDVERLIDNYVKFGLVGAKPALKNKNEFARRVSNDPIAVACSRILNDFRPLDKIISEIWSESTQVEKDRYLIAALAQHCFRGGVRYDVLASAVARPGLKDQLRKDHVLPLAFYDDRSASFLIPQNATLAQRVLTTASQDNRPRLLEACVALANQIAPRVNRKTIRGRSPESRLAGRLFDFDSVAGDLLKDLAFEFYQRTQDAWQWNSRYWEQLALLHLAKYFVAHTSSDLSDLNFAAQHARHAVAIEHHPLPLTTLGKILLAQMGVRGFSLSASYAEAYEKLTEAIQLEKSWSRKAIQPYVTLFRGTTEYVLQKGVLSMKQIETIQALAKDAEKIFGRDPEMQDVLGGLRTALR